MPGDDTGDMDALELFADADVEVLVGGGIPDGRDDLGPLASLLAEVRRSATIEPPPMAAGLRAQLDAAPSPLRAVPSLPDRRGGAGQVARWRTAVAASVASAALVAGVGVSAAQNSLPAFVQDLVSSSARMVGVAVPRSADRVGPPPEAPGGSVPAGSGGPVAPADPANPAVGDAVDRRDRADESPSDTAPGRRREQSPSQTAPGQAGEPTPPTTPTPDPGQGSEPPEPEPTSGPNPGPGQPGQDQSGPNPGPGQPGQGQPGPGQPDQGQPGQGPNPGPAQGQPGQGQPGPNPDPGPGQPGQGQQGPGQPGPAQGQPGQGQPGPGTQGTADGAGEAVPSDQHQAPAGPGPMTQARP